MSASPPTGDSPNLSSAAAVHAVVRHAVGQHGSAHVDTWYVRCDQYVVAAVTTEPPALRLVVKLEQQGCRAVAVLSPMVSNMSGHSAGPRFLAPGAWLFAHAAASSMSGGQSAGATAAALVTAGAPGVVRA